MKCLSFFPKLLLRCLKLLLNGTEMTQRFRFPLFNWLTKSLARIDCVKLRSLVHDLSFWKRYFLNSLEVLIISVELLQILKGNLSCFGAIFSFLQKATQGDFQKYTDIEFCSRYQWLLKCLPKHLNTHARNVHVWRALWIWKASSIHFARMFRRFGQKSFITTTKFDICGFLEISLSCFSNKSFSFHSPCIVFECKVELLWNSFQKAAA